MKRLIVLPLSFFIFLTIFSINVRAYLPITNVSAGTDLGIPKQFTCINSTLDNKIYCYAFAGASHKIYRFNETLQDRQYCTLNNTYTEYGGVIANSTVAYILYSGGTILGFNITTINGGSCPMVDSQTLSGTTAGAYYLGTHSLGDNLFFMGNGIKDSVFEGVEGAWWDEGSLSNNTAILSNRSDNSTVYIMKTGGLGAIINTLIFKYINKAFNKTIDYQALWGFKSSSTDFILASLIKRNASTTVGYFLDATHNRLYKVNFSAGEFIGLGTTIIAIKPINNQTLTASPITLEISISTANNGTVYFYLNNVLKGSQSITAPQTDAHYYQSVGSLANGNYSWNATFTDLYGNSWYTDIQYFTKTTLPTADAVASYIGLYLFGITDLDLSKALTSIILTLLLSLMTIVALATLKIGSEVLGKIFLYENFIWLIFFTILGWFYAWLLLIILAIAGFLIFKELKGG
jgi:hypothetical protein